MQPYRTPIISWDTRPQDGVSSYTLSITGLGDASSITTPNPLVFTWGTPLPVFPYLAMFLEVLLGITSSDDNTWRVRWVFDQTNFDPTFNPQGSRRHEPKLALLAADDEGYASGSIILTASAPNEVLTTDYDATVGKNWIGTDGVSETFTFPFPGEIACVLSHPPSGVFGPQVLQYGDNRSVSRSTGQATNPFSHRKRVSTWGTRYEREMTFPLVHARNLYGYRRIDPLFEEVALRRRNPNNLYEVFTESLQYDLDYFIWTEVPDPNITNSADYFAGFRGRRAKVLATDLLAEDSSGNSYQEADFRLGNLSIGFVEPDTSPLVTTSGGLTITAGGAP